MIIIDETKRAAPSLECLFQGEFDTHTLTSEELVTTSNADTGWPNLALFVSKGDAKTTKARVEHIRTMWPKTVVVLLLPGVESERQLGKTVIPAHKILFSPCTKQRVLDTVANYRTLFSDNTSDGSMAILAPLIEFVGQNRPSLYIAHNSISSHIKSLCDAIGGDWRHIQQVLTLYIVLLANLEQSLVDNFLDNGRIDTSTLQELNEHLQKMADLLEMSPSTKELAPEIQYMLKRYDGSGYPKDDVSGLDIPMAARIVSLLMDYHFLIHSGKKPGQALFTLHQQSAWYDDVLLQAFIDIHGDDSKKLIREVYPLGLTVGMEIAEDVYGMIDGKRRKILACNEILTPKAIDYLQRHSEDVLDITEPIQVFEDIFSPGGCSCV